jgi:IS605 OrfB family transposase
VCFEHNDRIRINLTKEDSRFIPEFGEITKENTIGADINIKHNLFALSDKEGNIIDYDRKLLNDYVKFLKGLDESKKQKKILGLNKEDANKLSNENQVKLDKWIVRITDMLKRKCNQFVKYSVKGGKLNIVLEDLKSFAKSFVRNEEFDGFKYTRLIAMLHFTTIKEIVKSIAYKNNITVTFIDPKYTSQQCHKCGHISKDNRKDQETFHCVHCGCHCNADYNAAKNIEYRLLRNVLRDNLLTQNDMGEFIQKPFSKWKLMDLLDLYSYNRNDKEPDVNDFTNFHSFL